MGLAFSVYIGLLPVITDTVNTDQSVRSLYILKLLYFSFHILFSGTRSLSPSSA